MFSAFAANAVTFLKGHLLSHRMRVTEEHTESSDEGARTEGREKKTMGEDRNLHVHNAHPLLYEAKHTC